MKDRIRHLMESQHMTQNTFAQFIGLSPATLSSIFNGRTNPTLATVEAIKKKLPLLNLEWMMMGIGPMYKDGVEASAGDEANNGSSSGEPSLQFANDTASAPTPLVEQPHRTSAQFQQKNASNFNVKYFDKNPKSITEIRVFFSDQTYESFVPKK